MRTVPEVELGEGGEQSRQLAGGPCEPARQQLGASLPSFLSIPYLTCQQALTIFPNTVLKTELLDVICFNLFLVPRL